MSSADPAPPRLGHKLLSPSFVFLLLGTAPLDKGQREPSCSLMLVMLLMLSRSYSWTATSTPALARGRAERRGKAGGISLKAAVDLLEKALFLFRVFLWGEGFFS